jgi:drug/metabolite transporter (DMT)-like permease
MNSRAFWAVFISAIIAGTSGLFIKGMSINSISQTGLRMAVPAIFTIIWMLGTRTPFFRGNWKKMLGISVLGTLRLLLFFLAYNLTTLGNAVIMFYTYPIISAALGYLILREIVSKRQQTLLFVAFLGILIVFSGKEFSFENQDFLGMLAAMGSAFIFALNVVLFRSETKNYSEKEMLFYQNFVGFVVLMPFFEFDSATTLDYTLGISYGLLIGILKYFFSLHEKN